jgi:hypothetical protein
MKIEHIQYLSPFENVNLDNENIDADSAAKEGPDQALKDTINSDL